MPALAPVDNPPFDGPDFTDPVPLDELAAVERVPKVEVVEGKALEEKEEGVDVEVDVDVDVDAQLAD